MSSLTGLDDQHKREDGREHEAADPDFQAEYPGVYEWLARVVDNGEERKVATLTVKFRDGGVNLCLSASQEGVVGFHQGETVHEALEGLEHRLQASKMDWKKRQEGWRKS